MEHGEVPLNEGPEMAKRGDGEELINVIERDPTHVNDHLKITFEEIFAEPHPPVFSFDSVWQTSFKVFHVTRLWSYRILTLVFAVPAAVLWGVYFACLTCCSVWCCRPYTRACSIKMACCKDTHSIVLNTFVRPCFEAVGFLFNNFRVFLVKGNSATGLT